MSDEPEKIDPDDDECDCDECSFSDAYLAALLAVNRQSPGGDQ